MKKAQPHSVLPRSRPSTAPGSSSRGDDPPLNVRSLGDNLPNPTTSRRPGPVPSSRRASLGQQESPKVPSRRASLDQQALSKPRSGSPRVSVSCHSKVSSLGKRITKKEGDDAKSAVRKSTLRKATNGEGTRSGSSGKEVEAVAANLPLDSLCLCLEKLHSIYHIVTCASVCRHWRDAVLSDMVWKALYLRWWHQEEEDKGASSTMSSPGMRVPPGFDTWRAAFVSNYSAGKQKIRSEVIIQGVNAGWLRVRRVPDRRGNQVSDCMPGDAMRKIVNELGLTFHVQINREPPVRLRGKASVVYVPGSCFLRYPTKTTKTGLSLRSLKSFKLSTASVLKSITWILFVTATSDRLLRTCTVASFTTCMGGPWEMVSREVQSPGPLRLLQQTPKPSTSLIVYITGMQAFSFTFGKLLWRQEFHQVFCSPRESTPGQAAVFLLISSHEVFPGMLTSPWRTEAFSGELRGVFMLHFTLWDAEMEIAWHCTRAVRTYPAKLATVEYAPPGMDGERVHTGVQDEVGVSVSMNMCTPFSDG